MSTVSVITIPLKTEKWHEDVLFKRFEACRNIYNAMLGFELKQYKKLTESEQYKSSIEVIYSYYRTDDNDEKERIKKSDEYKNALKTQNVLFKEFGFTSYEFGKTAISFSKHYRAIIPTKVAQMSVGYTLWAAFERMIYGNGNSVHFKKYDTFSSLVTDGKSAIRIVGPDRRTVMRMNPYGKYSLAFTTRSEHGKNLYIPLLVDREDKYLLEMMERDIHTVRIIRKKVRNRYRYYVQLTVSGTPAIKRDEDGKELHTVKQGKLGVYIDTTSITIVSDDGTSTIDIKRENTIEDTIAELTSFMEESKRISNPENFNDDGSIKTGIPLNWEYSKNYLKAKNKRADLLRKDREQRKIDANIIANSIMAMGNDVVINDYPFQAAAKRKKFAEGEELTKNGRPRRKRKAGKAINENAPALIVTTLDAKLKARGYNGVKKVRLKDVDYRIEEYRTVYARQLYDM